MLRAGKLTRLAAGLAGLTGACTLLALGLAAGLVPGLAAAATASGGPGVGGPGVGGLGGVAALMTAPKTFTAVYSCDLSAFGTAVAPVSVSATLSFPASVPFGNLLGITLKTASVSLPASVLGKLAGVKAFDLTAAVTAPQGLSSIIPLNGLAPVPGTLTGLPASTAIGSVVFFQTGTVTIKVPAPSLTFTPRTSSSAGGAGAGAAPPSITCTTTAARRAIPVTVTPLVIGKAGPLYKCAYATAGFHFKILFHVPVTVTSAGSRTTGTTDTVTLVLGVGGPYDPGSSSIRFTSDLPVAGAQPGKIPLSAKITDLASTKTRASGKLALTKAGTDRIGVPEEFMISLDEPGPKGKIHIAITCALTTSHVPVALTMTVTKGTRPGPSPTPTDNGGQGQGAGTPQGAPATGGGPAPGADLVAAAGGLAMAASGGGLALLGIRRRRAGGAGPASRS